MDLQYSRKISTLSLSATVVAMLLFVSPAFAASSQSQTSSNSSKSVFTANPPKSMVTGASTASAINGIAPFCGSGVLCYPPQFIATAYDFPATHGAGALTGKGQTIVIVDAFGSPTLQSDLNTFDTTFGLPSGTVTVLCGPTWTGSKADHCPKPSPGSPIDLLCGEEGWAYETTLDVQMSHAMAPGAKIVLVVSTDCLDTSFNAAEAAVVAQSKYAGSIMSQSFGEPEHGAGCSSTCGGYNATIVNAAHAIYSSAIAQGWTVLASSGDDGANTNTFVSGTTELTAAWPSTDPLVLATGGTMGSPVGGQYGLNLPSTCAPHKFCNTGLVTMLGGESGCGTGANLAPSGCRPIGYGGESAWNEYNIFGAGTSTGGGISSIYGRPSFQSALPHSYTTLFGSTVKANGRAVPDVAFNAAIMGGILNYDGFPSIWGGTNGYYILGGTSAASPAWAAIVALLGQAHGGPVGYITPQIYQLAESSSYSTVFHDISTGNNSISAGQLGIDGFNAGKGYDLTTGWGSVDVSNFIAEMLPLL